MLTKHLLTLSCVYTIERSPCKLQLIIGGIIENVSYHSRIAFCYPLYNGNTIPYCSVKRKKEQVKWRAALILFIILFLASILINISIVNKYGLNFFSNPFEFATALLVVGLIAGIVAILAFIQLYFFRRGKNTKGIRDMKVYFVGFIGYSILLLFLLAWIMPLI